MFHFSSLSNHLEGHRYRGLYHSRKTKYRSRYLDVTFSALLLIILGPLFLLLGYSFWSCIIYLVNECVAVPTSRLPVENAFVDFAVRYVSPGVGMSIGYNYFLGMVCSSSWVSNSTNFHKIGLLCFEITNFGNVIDFWTSEPLHPAILTSVCIVTYALIHCWDSRWFGESEFVSTLR